MGSHSVIPPSAAKCWVACPGWVTMNAAYNSDESSEAAQDGTACHAVAEAILNATLGSAKRPPVAGDTVEGRIVTEQMIEAAGMYATYVAGIISKCGITKKPRIGFEKRVECPNIHELSAGTVDAYVWDSAENTLHLFDLKYGFGVVEAVENWQLINYADGVMSYLDVIASTVVFHIVQPRAFHKEGPIRTWSVDGDTLDALHNRLHDAALEALSDSPECRTGEHCKYCAGRTHCEAAISAGYNAVDMSSGVLPVNASNEELGRMLEDFKRGEEQLKYMIDAVETQLSTALRSGERVEGYRLTESRGRTMWSLSADEVIALGDEHGIDLRKPDTVTPKQAQKLGLPADIVTENSEHSASMKLERINNDRARAVFARKVG